MPRTLALIPTDTQVSRLGLPARLHEKFDGKTVLAHTVERVAMTRNIDAIVILHPEDRDPAPLITQVKPAQPLHFFPIKPGHFNDDRTPMRIAARKWSLTAWRGGIGGMTCYDELLPAKPLAEALHHFQGDSALLVGPDWPSVDPELCSKVLALHLTDPVALKMTFSLAPPGLCGVAIASTLLDEMAQQPDATFGRMLAYNPTHPQPDPIGRDVCVQVEASIRSLPHRYIHDTPGSMIRGHEGDDAHQALPQQTTLELTPRRAVTGPVTPQHHVTLDRPDLETALAMRVIDQLATRPDVALTLGGLGDALLHPEWHRIVEHAHNAGVLGIAVETDLLCDETDIERLLSLPIDAVIVNLNADRAVTYEIAMGGDRFNVAIANLEKLLNGRAHSSRPPNLPWVVPRIVKSKLTLDDMESFFDRWTHFAGHAIIQPATDGCGLIPPGSEILGPVDMTPPARKPCRQVGQRMTIHSDGRVALCDQDWLSQGAIGDARTQSLTEIWQAALKHKATHQRGEWATLTPCKSCKEWHRP
ncbi:MAG: hypothetical protein GC164_02480 [Phycisphaera sp.]|nr:hypothetical protein [Phycisphaera sp.]